MSENTFTKIGESDDRLYGPRALLVCGHPAAEQAALLEVLTGIGLADVPVVFAGKDEGDASLGGALRLPDRTGWGEDSDLRRAVVMSGVTERELKAIMAAYRASGLAPPLWATPTPISEEWTVRALLDELAAEAEAFRQRSRANPDAEGDGR